VTANSLEEAAAKSQALESLPTVDHVVSLATFVPDQQKEKLAELAAIRQELAGVNPGKYEEDLSLMELPTVFENFRTATAKHATRIIEITLKNAKIISIFQRIALHECFMFKRIRIPTPCCENMKSLFARICVVE